MLERDEVGEETGLLAMSKEEKREYERNRKRQQRMNKKLESEETGRNEAGVDELEDTTEMHLEESDIEVDILEEKEVEEEEMEMEAGIEEIEQEGEDMIDLEIEPENDLIVSNLKPATAKAILNIMEKSPRKNSSKIYIIDKINTILDIYTDVEKLDVLVVLAHFLNNDVKFILQDYGIDIRTLPRKVKRTTFSSMTSSTKFRIKDKLLDYIE